MDRQVNSIHVKDTGRTEAPANGMRNTAAFTLLEVVLAVAVSAFVLTAATAYLISVIDIWNAREDRHFFEDHVDGVTEFLAASFSAAGYEISTSSGSSGQTDGSDGSDPSDDAGDEPKLEINTGARSPTNRPDSTSTSKTSGSLVTRAEAPISWESLPGAASFDKPLLSFSLNTRPPLLVSAEQIPFTKTQVYLHFDREDGLSLLWSSNLQEELEDVNDLRRSEVSPLVSAILYIYWDERFEQWEELDEPKEGEGDEDYLLPRYIKLIFEYEGVTTERLLTIPIPSTSAAIY
ncbi:PulJ/GspJ family protein [Coraliomargarita akajimensis]|uniref:Prepilin-type N-terminal cleavage/methylation domain-containing protein n=1 Tax=Coraliomargarita akajimensis (strain DSM 45221 / IAM 15411 / JCM 23193 / KCTC 12865 / 04OKA010-24) TaxID=583355 RepID=D5EJQ8_CORAD|nr:prepilin-type N-terminal cleavage/methylation domain-containing protein [Coraliomargarita akajimensis]ADE54657.1 hypothetical protein Caka_1638 [Coraliomargarita akajimensis DSM 45221]